MLINKLDIDNILSNFWFKNDYWFKFIKYDEYHQVCEIIYDNHIFILKKINKYNHFLVNNIPLLIEKWLLQDIIRNINNNYITDLNNNLYILYKKIDWETLKEKYIDWEVTELIIKQAINSIKKWHYLKVPIEDKNKNIIWIKLIRELKENIIFLKENLKLTNINFSDLLLDYNISRNSIQITWLTHNNITLENIIIWKNDFILIDYDTISYWNQVVDILSLLISLFQENQDLDLFEILLKEVVLEYNISEKNMNFYLIFSVTEYIIIYLLEKDNKYFISENLESIKSLLKLYKYIKNDRN